jgi:hypothetical protein
MADDNIRHVNCASDFRIVFAFSDGKLPDYPWRLGLKTPNTPSYNMYVASFDGTTYNNCSPLDDESIMVFVDHHRLAPGILHYYLQTDAPDSLFPDGEMNVTIPGTVNIELWEGPSDGDTPPEVTVIVERLLKGDPGDPGEAGQITSATASIDNTTGTPSVKIELGGTPEKRTIDLKFSGLKGEPGEPDESFVRYDKAQDLTTSEQEQAWLNLGFDLVVLKFPKGVTSITLTDEEDAKLQSGAAVLVTTDSTDTTSNIYNANNHIFTPIDFKATSRPLYYSLALFSGLLHCSYDKESKTFAYHGIIRLIDSGALRTDRQTSLSSIQQSQAFENLGWNVHVISESAIGSSDAVSDDEKEARLAATALLVQETGLLYNFSISSGGNRRFYGQFSNSFCTALNVNEATGVITSSFAYLYDPSAVSFDRDQSNVSDDNKNKALGNIGIDLVRLPYSLLNTTLSDEMLEVVDNARGIILVDTPSDYRNPTVFVKGNNVSESCIFVAFVTGNTYSIFTLNKSTKLLSGISSGLTYGGSVRYAEDQNLSNTQKDTVLSNIGLNWIHVQYSLLGTTLDDATYTKLTNAYGIILTDVPSDYFGPREFICGANNSDGTKVFAGLNLANTSAYIVLYANHRLSTVRYLRTYDGAVPYDASKALTSAQQAVARTNIGVQSADELLADDDFIASLKTKLGIG